MNNIEFFKQAGYGMMMHFGLYSVLGGEYKGKFGDNYAECIGSHFAIPIKEYEKLAEVFNPIYFDADEIIGLAKEWNEIFCGNCKAPRRICSFSFEG